jgi:arthrofactin-type cyclic lipopeptide synthetase C
LGELGYARILARHIAPDIPIYGLAGPLAAPSSHADYRRNDSAHGANGPGGQAAGTYRLAGWAFGGILAYEVAAQLIGAD